MLSYGVQPSYLENMKLVEYLVHICFPQVWVVGEYTSTSYDQRCSTDTIIKFYEALETLLYEISVLVQSTAEGKDLYSVRLMTVMMTALSKVSKVLKNNGLLVECKKICRYVVKITIYFTIETQIQIIGENLGSGARIMHHIM